MNLKNLPTKEQIKLIITGNLTDIYWNKEFINFNKIYYHSIK